MSSETSSINESPDEGEEVVFRYEDFKDSNDLNVKILYGIFNFLQDERERIMNLNALKEDAGSEDDEYPFKYYCFLLSPCAFLTFREIN